MWILVHLICWTFHSFVLGDSYLKILSSSFFFDIIMRKDDYMCAYHLIEKIHRKIKWIVILHFVVFFFFFLLFRNLDLIILAMCLEYLYSWSANWLVICYLSYKGFWFEHTVIQHFIRYFSSLIFFFHPQICPTLMLHASLLSHKLNVFISFIQLIFCFSI